MVKKISKGATYLSLVTLLSPLVLQSRQVFAEESNDTTEQTEEQKITPSAKEETTEEKKTTPSSEEKTAESTKEELTVGDLDIQLPAVGNATETLNPDTPIVSKDENGNIYQVGKTEDGRIIQSSARTNPLLRGIGNVQGEIIRITIAGVLYEGIKITVDGKGALCVDRDLRAPFEPDVPYDNGSIWSDKGAVSILSHGAYGPLNPNPTDEQIILTEIALYNWKTNKLTPNEAISNTHPYVADLIEKAKQEDIVNKVITFSDKSVESIIVGKEQVSKTIKVNGDADNQVSIPVPMDLLDNMAQLADFNLNNRTIVTDKGAEIGLLSVRPKIGVDWLAELHAKKERQARLEQYQQAQSQIMQRSQEQQMNYSRG